MDDSESLQPSSSIKYLEALVIPFSVAYLNPIWVRSIAVYLDFPPTFLYPLVCPFYFPAREWATFARLHTGKQRTIFPCHKLYRAILWSKRTQLHRVWIGVACGNYYGRNSIWWFSHQLLTHKIKVPAKFSDYTVVHPENFFAWFQFDGPLPGFRSQLSNIIHAVCLYTHKSLNFKVVGECSHSRTKINVAKFSNCE